VQPRAGLSTARDESVDRTLALVHIANRQLAAAVGVGGENASSSSDSALSDVKPKSLDSYAVQRMFPVNAVTPGYTAAKSKVSQLRTADTSVGESLAVGARVPAYMNPHT